jgi:hypothetical protein
VSSPRGVADTEPPPDPRAHVPRREQADTEPSRRKSMGDHDRQSSAAYEESTEPPRRVKSSDRSARVEEPEEPQEEEATPPPRRGRPAPAPARSARQEEPDEPEDEQAEDEEEDADDNRSRPAARGKPAGKRRDSQQEDSDIAASVFARASAPKKEIGQLVTEAFNIYKGNLVPLALTALVIVVPGQFVAALVPGLLSKVFGLFPVALAIRLTVLLTVAAAALMGAIVQQTAIGGVTIGIADRLLGGDGGWQRYFARTLALLPRLLSALVPFALAILAVGALALVAPGLASLATVALYVGAFFFCFTPMVVLVEGTAGPAALMRSVELVKSDIVRVLLVALVCLVATIAAGIVGAIVAAIPVGIIVGILTAINASLGIYVGMLLAAILGGIFIAVVLPFSTAGLALLYFDLRRKKDRQANQLRDQLEELVR